MMTKTISSTQSSSEDIMAISDGDSDDDMFYEDDGREDDMREGKVYAFSDDGHIDFETTSSDTTVSIDNDGASMVVDLSDSVDAGIDSIRGLPVSDLRVAMWNIRDFGGGPSGTWSLPGDGRLLDWMNGTHSLQSDEAEGEVKQKFENLEQRIINLSNHIGTLKSDITVLLEMHTRGKASETLGDSDPRLELFLLGIWCRILNNPKPTLPLLDWGQKIASSTNENIRKLETRLGKLEKKDKEEDNSEKNSEVVDILFNIEKEKENQRRLELVEMQKDIVTDKDDFFWQGFELDNPPKTYIIASREVTLNKKEFDSGVDLERVSHWLNEQLDSIGVSCNKDIARATDLSPLQLMALSCTVYLFFYRAREAKPLYDEVPIAEKKYGPSYRKFLLYISRGEVNVNILGKNENELLNRIARFWQLMVNHRLNALGASINRADFEGSGFALEQLTNALNHRASKEVQHSQINLIDSKKGKGETIAYLHSDQWIFNGHEEIDLGVEKNFCRPLYILHFQRKDNSAKKISIFAIHAPAPSHWTGLDEVYARKWMKELVNNISQYHSSEGHIYLLSADMNIDEDVIDDSKYSSFFNLFYPDIDDHKSIKTTYARMSKKGKEGDQKWASAYDKILIRKSEDNNAILSLSYATENRWSNNNAALNYSDHSFLIGGISRISDRKRPVGDVDSGSESIDDDTDDDGLGEKRPKHIHETREIEMFDEE